MCTVNQLVGALREGRELPGNMVHTSNLEEVMHLQDLWQTYQVTNDKWFDHNHHRRHYRKLFIPTPERDKTSSIISELANASGVQAHLLTGGRWEKQTFGAKGHHIIGWLRIPTGTASKILETSGRRAIFSSLQLEHGRTHQMKTKWIHRFADETPEQYRDRVQKLAKDRKQPVLFRKGFGNDLGFECQATDPAETKSLVLELQGVPNFWQAEEISEFLALQKWTEVRVLTKKRDKRRSTWLVRATPPMQEAGRTSWMFDFEDGPGTSFQIYLNEAPPRPTKPTERSYLSAPKKTWSSTEVPAEKSSRESRTEARIPHDHEARDRSRSRGSEHEQKNSDSQPAHDASRQVHCRAGKGRSSQKTEPTEPHDPFVLGWRQVDQQGHGDCGCRSIAQAIHFLKHGQDLEKRHVYGKRHGSEARPFNTFASTSNCTLTC